MNRNFADADGTGTSSCSCIVFSFLTVSTRANGGCPFVAIRCAVVLISAAAL